MSENKHMDAIMSPDELRNVVSDLIKNNAYSVEIIESDGSSISFKVLISGDEGIDKAFKKESNTIRTSNNLVNIHRRYAYEYQKLYNEYQTLLADGRNTR